MSFSIVAGIFVAGLTSSGVVPAAKAQIIQEIAVESPNGRLVGTVIAAQGVVVNGVNTNALISGGVRINNTVVDSGCGFSVLGYNSTGDTVYALGVFTSGNLTGGEAGGPNGVFTSGNFTDGDEPDGPNGVFTSGNFTDGDEPGSPNGVFTSGNVYVGDSLQLIGGVLSGNNIQIINGVISGSNLQVTGGYVTSTCGN